MAKMSANLVRNAKCRKCSYKVLTSETQVLRNKPALRAQIFSRNSRTWLANEKHSETHFQVPSFVHTCRVASRKQQLYTESCTCRSKRADKLLAQIRTGEKRGTSSSTIGCGTDCMGGSSPADTPA